MKPDIEYIKQFLDIAEACPAPFFNTHEFDRAGLKIDDRFVFHLLLLRDKGLVEHWEEAADHTMGIVIDMPAESAGHEVARATPTPLRLTSAGHDFAASLRTSKALDAAKGAMTYGLSFAVNTALAVAVDEGKRYLGLAP